MMKGSRQIVLGFVVSLAALLFASAMARGAFSFNSITGPAETFGPGAGSQTVPGSVSLTSNGVATSDWTITTNWAINYIGGDKRCQFTAFDPGAPFKKTGWSYPTGTAGVASNGTFTWDSPNVGSTPISADYIVGFSSTATSGANTLTFDGNIDVTIVGLVPEPSAITLMSTSAVGILCIRRRSLQRTSQPCDGIQSGG